METAAIIYSILAWIPWFDLKPRACTVITESLLDYFFITRESGGQDKILFWHLNFIVLLDLSFFFAASDVLNLSDTYAGIIKLASDYILPASLYIR